MAEFDAVTSSVDVVAENSQVISEWKIQEVTLEGVITEAQVIGQITTAELVGQITENVVMETQEVATFIAEIHYWAQGQGVPTGGTAWQFLKKSSEVDFDTVWVTLAMSDVTGLVSALSWKEPTINAGTTSQYWRGDKTWQTLDKTAVWLGNVDNTSDLAKPISTLTQSALDAKADLVAGKVPASQLPAYVDDVVEADDFASLPGTGETGKIYVTLDDSKTYRWGGSSYVEISESLALGETSSTAYRGDRGKTAYDHSQITGNPHNTAIGDISGLQTALDSKVNTSLTLTINGVGYDLSENRSWTVESGGTPAGSTSYIQYNTWGAFDAKSTFVFVEDLDAVGIQVSSPLASFHTASSTGSTLSPVTTGSIALVSELTITSPTGSITKIAEPAAWSGGSVSFINEWSGNFYGDGTTYYFKIYPVLTDSSTYYRSQFYEIQSNAIPTDYQNWDIQLSWGSVTISGETVDYFIEYSTNDIDYYPYGVYSGGTSTTITSLSGSDSTTPWNDFYKAWSWVTGPDAPVSFDSYSENTSYYNFYSSWNYYEYELDTYKDISGTKYVSGSPIILGTYDNSSFMNFAWDLYWSLAGTYDGVILRRQINSGGWSYIDLWSTTNYIDDNFSDDGVSSGVWGNTYSGGSSDVTFAYDVWGKWLSPSSQTYYATSGNTYSTTILWADTSRYIFKHTFSGLPAQGAKILAPSGAVNYGKNINSSYYDNWYTNWGDGTTVTPNSYGFTGTNQNRAYYLHSSGLGIFSSVSYDLDTTSEGGTKSVAVTGITYPAWVTSIRVYRQVNGTGNFYYKTLSSPTSTFIDDSLDTSWTNAGSSYPPSPTSIIPGAGRFDRNNTSRTDPTILDIVATGTGTRYPKITFSVATNSATTPSRLADILVNSSTGYMELVTGRVDFTASLGASAYATISSYTFFNQTRSSSGHFTVSGQNDIYLINTRADQDTVYFWQQASGVDNQTTLQIQPARSWDRAIVIRGHSSMTNTSEIMRWQDNGWSYKAAMSLGGYLWLGRTSAPSNAILALWAATGFTQLLFDNHGTPATVNGGMYYSSSNFYGTDSSTNRRFVRMASSSAGGSTFVPYFDSNGFLTAEGTFSYSAASDTLSVVNINIAKMVANSSAGVLFEANNGTDIALFWPGNTANVTFYGAVNIDGNTRLATSLSGIIKATSGVLSAIVWASGTFTTADLKTVTVTDWVITSIV